MGVVFRARDERLDRDVALKSPLADGAASEDVQRVVREARAASRVSHPHIVTIYEVLEVDGRPWIAMELVEGETVRDALRLKGRLPLEDAIRMVEDIAEALDAAHERGVLHRDVNPHNIMMSPRGGARLMDFGLARMVEPDTTQVSTKTVGSESQVVGTVGYMAPEQILGRGASTASDVFALGAVAFEAITGARAFSGQSTGDVFDATLHREPPPIAKFVADAPTEIDRIVHKALAKRADERYQSARELAADVRAVRRRLESDEHLPITPPARRIPWKAAAAALAVAVAVAAVRLNRDTPPSALNSPRQLTSMSGWEAEPALSPDGSLVAYASNQSGNADIWLLDVVGGQSLRLTDDRADDRAPAWFPDGTSLAFVSDRSGVTGIWRTARLGGSATLVLPDAVDPAIAPDARRIAFARRDASGFFRIWVAPLDDPPTARMLTTTVAGLWDHRQPAWSPDGALVVYAAARDLWIVPSGGGTARRLTAADATDLNPVWSRDGRFIFFSSNREGTFTLWRVPRDGGTAVRMTGGHGPERHASISALGTQVVYSTFEDNADLFLRQLDTGAEVRLGGERIERSPVFAPDRQSMAFVSDRWGGRYDIWLQPLEARRPAGEPHRVTNHPGSVAQPAFSPDGRWIAYHRVLDGQRDIWIAPVDGAAASQFTTSPASDIHPDWSPDGQEIVFVSDRSGADEIRLAPVREGRPGGEGRAIPGGGLLIDAPTWSPDSATIAFVGQAGDERDAYLVDAAGGRPPRRLTTGAGAWRVAWNRATGQLWASGFWGGRVLSLRILDTGSGAMTTPEPPVILSADPASSDFDLAWDGRHVAFARYEPRGDLWIYQLPRGQSW